MKNTFLYQWNQLSKTDKIHIVLMVVMQMSLVGAFIFALFEKAWLTVFVALTALVTTVWLPVWLEKNLRIVVPLEFLFLLNVFIYGSLFLGEIQSFYTRFWWWDLVLHMGSGIALGFVGFLVFFTLHRSNRLNIQPSLIALFSFCFALSLGTLWEVFEFTADTLVGSNMQKSGLVDTMWDLIVDTLGATIASISGYLYMRYRWRGVGIFEYYLNAYLLKNRL